MTPYGPSVVGFDIAFLALVLFTGFFLGLVLWLHRESKREGYPLAKDTQDRYTRKVIQGFPAVPPPKTFKTAAGDVVVKGGRPDTRHIALKAREPWPGAPLDPTGDPLVDGVGPASWAERADVPDAMSHGGPRILPLRVAKDFHVAGEDPDPVGMEVIGGDGKVAGVVRDVWVDKAEYVLRYLEAEVPTGPTTSRRILVPANFIRYDAGRRKAHVKALFAKHFANVPGLKNPDQVTLLEEDKIMGYFGGGLLYASPQRMEPVL